MKRRDWTPEQREELRRRWNASELASDIAVALGFTRNEVIAEAHRITPLSDGSLPKVRQ